MKRALLVAFHFPPMQGSSGLQRTLKFCKYLPHHGWLPNVLSVRPSAYPDVSNDLLQEIPPDIQVTRAFALDAARHLSIIGRYPRFIALPDRWSNWIVPGFMSGVKLIRETRPSIVWSTYPIASAHLIAFLLHKAFHLPWVVDIRDPMVESGYPTNKALRRTLTWIENKAVERASRVILTTEGTARLYRNRYPESASKFSCIHNGFDEYDFERVEHKVDTNRCSIPPKKKRLTLLHSGIVYVSERDPTAFFQAIATLIRNRRLEGDGLLVKFRACRNEPELQALSRKFGLEEIVRLLPPLPYVQALEEMYRADALILMQGANCNEQIPAKVFEYMRTGKPILALTDRAGDTGRIVAESGVNSIAPLDDSRLIAETLEVFLEDLRQGRAIGSSPIFARKFSRESQAAGLADLFDEVIA